MTRTRVWLMRTLGTMALFGAAAGFLDAHPAAADAGKTDGSWKAPEFTHASADDWIASKPLRLADLRGQVVLIDFWTFGCWNCYRSFPWLKAVEARLHGERFRVVGVHAPEFEHERERDRVVAKMQEFGLRHPVMIDNDFSYWRAMGNQYWPSYYLVDKRGIVRDVFVGETHDDTDKARAIEANIRKLLRE